VYEVHEITVRAVGGWELWPRLAWSLVAASGGPSGQTVFSFGPEDSDSPVVVVHGVRTEKFRSEPLYFVCAVVFDNSIWYFTQLPPPQWLNLITIATTFLSVLPQSFPTVFAIIRPYVFECLWCKCCTYMVNRNLKLLRYVFDRLSDIYVSFGVCCRVPFATPQRAGVGRCVRSELYVEAPTRLSPSTGFAITSHYNNIILLFDMGIENCHRVRIRLHTIWMSSTLQLYGIVTLFHYILLLFITFHK